MKHIKKEKFCKNNTGWGEHVFHFACKGILSGILMFLCLIYAQGQTEDSLLNVLKNTDKSRQFHVLNELFNLYYKSNPKKAIEIGEQMIDLSKKLKETSVEKDLLPEIAYLNTRIGNLSEAIQIYEKCIDIYQSENNPEGIAYVKSSLAKIYKYKEKTVRAMELANEAASIYENLGKYHNNAILYKF